MRADFKVVLDACVLANYSLCDLLLRLAETPRLYLPIWSDRILQEVQHAHEKLSWPAHLAQSWQKAVREHFPEAMVEGWESFEDQCSNDEKDRHVLACAIKAQAELIVSFNLRHFPDGALAKWDKRAVHPQDYLLTLYSMEPALVVRRLGEISRKCDRALQDIVIHLGRSVPAFSQRVLEDLEL